MRPVLLLILVCAPLARAEPPQPANAVQSKPRSVLVMDLKGSVDPATLATITSTLAVSVAKRPHVSVLTNADVKQLVDVEAQKRLMGCDAGSESCLAEVASAMGADLVLYGDVGKLGELTVVNLNLFDAAAARAMGRETVQVKALDELPAQLDVAVRSILRPVTGESAGLAFQTGAAVVPTVDMDALKSKGLKAINMEAEKALESALDAQEDAAAGPEKKRDAWCALSHVSGSNPYLEPATKACNDWTSYAVQSSDLAKNITADYQTLSGFLDLRRKSKEQKLQAVDEFLNAYSKLKDKQEVKAVVRAREQLASSGAATLPKDTDGDGFLVDACPNEPEDFDGDRDDDGCPDTTIGENVAAAGSGAASAVGDVLGGSSDVIGFLPAGFGKDPYVGMGITLATFTDDPTKFDNAVPVFGYTVPISWGALDLGTGFLTDFNKTFLFTGRAGLELVEIPHGDFGLLRPGVGVDGAINISDRTITNPDGSTTSTSDNPLDYGVYLANTFRFSIVRVRVYYRYDLAAQLQRHSFGADLSVDFIALVGTS